MEGALVALAAVSQDDVCLGLLMFFGFHLKKRDRAADVAPENLSRLRGKG